MAFISVKTIKGKKRHYLERSVRLPTGKIKKYSVYLKNYNKKANYNLEVYKKLLDKKVESCLVSFSSEYYKQNSVYNKSLIEELEKIKIDYSKIVNKLSKNQLNDVLDRFTVNFTYESNALEGNSLTLKDVTLVLQEKKVIEGKDLKEIYETVNTREAFGLIFRNKLKINNEDILKLHKIIVNNTGVAFGYKKLPNFLIGRNVKTVMPEKVNEEMSKLIKWYNENKNLHPLLKAALFHGRFERIHPFDDGNGRVGRLIMNIILLNNGYAPLIIRKSHKTAYFSALEAFDNGYEDKLHRFIINKYKDTYRKFFKVYINYLE